MSLNLSNVDTTLHQPVLLTEVLQALNIRPDGIYIDCTFGRGGHSQAILQRLNTQGCLLAFDQDPDAVQAAHTIQDTRFRVLHSPFSQLLEMIKAHGWLGQVDGILFDLGVSSPQLDNPSRGFSFLHDGLLDMRMNPTQGDNVQTWLAKATLQQMADVFKTYGEERYARRIAKAIIAAREKSALTHTVQLANIIAAAHPAWEKGKHPATRCFQALRIFINQELEQLQQVLPQTLEILASGGRLVVISFHSLEDRIVKRFMRDAARGDNFPPHFPIPANALQSQLHLVNKPIFPSVGEIAINPRARSAVLRVAERCESNVHNSCS